MSGLVISCCVQKLAYFENGETIAYAMSYEYDPENDQDRVVVTLSQLPVPEVYGAMSAQQELAESVEVELAHKVWDR